MTTRIIDRLRIGLRSLFARRRAAADLDAELRFHIEQQTRENLARGMSAENARNAALRTFGNPALVREQTTPRGAGTGWIFGHAICASRCARSAARPDFRWW